MFSAIVAPPSGASREKKAASIALEHPNQANLEISRLPAFEQ
jgi:hypothetical protein